MEFDQSKLEAIAGTKDQSVLPKTPLLNIHEEEKKRGFMDRWWDNMAAAWEFTTRMPRTGEEAMNWVLLIGGIKYLGPRGFKLVSPAGGVKWIPLAKGWGPAAWQSRWASASQRARGIIDKAFSRSSARRKELHDDLIAAETKLKDKFRQLATGEGKFAADKNVLGRQRKKSLTAEEFDSLRLEYAGHVKEYSKFLEGLRVKAGGNRGGLSKNETKALDRYSSELKNMQRQLTKIARAIEVSPNPLHTHMMAFIINGERLSVGAIWSPLTPGRALNPPRIKVSAREKPKIPRRTFEKPGFGETWHPFLELIAAKPMKVVYSALFGKVGVVTWLWRALFGLTAFTKVGGWLVGKVAELLRWLGANENLVKFLEEDVAPKLEGMLGDLYISMGFGEWIKKQYAKNALSDEALKDWATWLDSTKRQAASEHIFIPGMGLYFFYGEKAHSQFLVSQQQYWEALVMNFVYNKMRKFRRADKANEAVVEILTDVRQHIYNLNKGVQADNSTPEEAFRKVFLTLNDELAARSAMPDEAITSMGKVKLTKHAKMKNFTMYSWNNLLYSQGKGGKKLGWLRQLEREARRDGKNKAANAISQINNEMNQYLSTHEQDWEKITPSKKTYFGDGNEKKKITPFEVCKKFQELTGGTTWGSLKRQWKKEEGEKSAQSAEETGEFKRLPGENDADFKTRLQKQLNKIQEHSEEDTFNKLFETETKVKKHDFIAALEGSPRFRDIVAINNKVCKNGDVLETFANIEGVCDDDDTPCSKVYQKALIRHIITDGKRSIMWKKAVDRRKDAAHRTAYELNKILKALSRRVEKDEFNPKKIADEEIFGD